LKIAAKPLQMKTWLLLEAYRKLPSLYTMVLFSHNWHQLDTNFFLSKP